MKDFRYCMALLLFAVCAAQARVVRIQIASREMVADGAAFGPSGPYEKLRGTAFFEVDPADVRNAVIFDLDKAPRNQHGMVEFSADIFILKPVDIRKGNGGLFVEPPNRGLKLGWDLVFQDAPSDAAISNPTSARDFGNGFLLRRGYTLVWVGWSPRLQPGADRLTAQFPEAIENGQPLTGMVVSEYFDGSFGGGRPFTLPLSGNPAYASYEAVSTDAAEAGAELRVRSSDSFRPADAEIPEGSVIPASEWSLAACPTGPPGTPSTRDICLAGGFQNDKVSSTRV